MAQADQNFYVAMPLVCSLLGLFFAAMGHYKASVVANAGAITLYFVGTVRR